MICAESQTGSLGNQIKRPDTLYALHMPLLYTGYRTQYTCLAGSDLRMTQLDMVCKAVP